MSERKIKWQPAVGAVILLIALGAFLRLFRLGQAMLWIDEITITWFAALPRTAPEIFRQIFEWNMQGWTGQHMPVQYALLNVFYWIYSAFGITDVSEFLTRLPYALLGILSLPFVYLAAKRYFGSTRAGLWALLLFSISLFQVSRSRDATGYAPLMFFIVLNGYGVTGLFLQDEGRLRKKNIWFLICYIIGTSGAFMTHLTSWLYLGPQGMIMAYIVGWPVYKAWSKHKPVGTVIKNNAWQLGGIAVLLLFALCFLRFPLSVSQGGGVAEDVRDTTLGFGHLVYQIAIYSWGRGNGRLATAVIIIACTLIGGWRRYRSRLIVILILIVIPATFWVAFNYKTFHPRYLSSLYPVYILFLTVGFCVLQDLFVRFIKIPYASQAFVGIVIVLLFMALQGPYRALFAVQSKVFPVYQVKQAVEQVIEPNAPFIWQNAHQARQLGQVYPIPGHECILGLYANGTGEPREQFRIMNDALKQLAHGIPNAVMIVDANDSFFFDPVYQWPRSYYKHEIKAELNTPVHQLHEWGYEDANFDPAHFQYSVLYNTTEEILEELRLNGQAAVWPTGAGWKYQWIQNGMTLIYNQGAVKLLMADYDATHTQFKLQVTGLPTGAGSLILTGPQLPPNGVYASFSPSANRLVRLELGPFSLNEGSQEMTYNIFPASEQPVFYAVGFELIPVTD